MAKTYNNREDFIKKISSMTDTELNNLIKAKGKPPKKVIMARIVSKTEE